MSPHPITLVRGPALLAGLALCLALAPLAHAGSTSEVTLELGQRFQGSLSSPDDQDRVAVTALPGQLLTLTLKGKGQAGATGRVTLLDESDQPISTAGFESGLGGKSFKLKKFPLPDSFSNAFTLLIESVGGSTGDYQLKTKVKTPKEMLKIKTSRFGAAGELESVPFLALAGTRLTASLKPGKGSAAVARLGDVDGPSGPQDLSSATTTSETKVKVKKAVLTETGNYTLGVLNEGAEGEVLVTLKLKPPKAPKTTVFEPGSGGTGTSGTLQGTLTVQEIPVLAEQEPNDDVEDTQFVAAFQAGSLARIVGEVGSSSDLDGFRLNIMEDQTLRIELVHEAATDLDVYVCDPSTFEIVAAFESTDYPEVGTLDISGVGAPFDLDVLIVGAFGSTGGYLATLTSTTLAGEASAAAPAAGPLALAPRAAFTPGGAGPVPAPAPAARAAQDRHAGLDRPFLGGELVVQLTDASRDPVTWAATRGLHVRASSPSGWFVVTDPELLAEADDHTRRLGTVLERERVAAQPSVRHVELNHLYQAFTTSTPDDEFLSYQWHYPLMNLPAAWAVAKGSTEVLVAILDTGVTAHPDLVPRDSGLGYDMISSAAVALDGDGPDDDPTDVGDQANPDGTSSWHGSHVAGTVGAATNNTIGVAGVDQACRLMHVRVLGSGGGSNFDIAEGVRYAANLPNSTGAVPGEAADVLNMSLGGPAFSQQLQDAVNAATAAGTLVIAAAGNENTSAPSFPAAMDNVLSVMAVDMLEQRAPYSNFGSTVDVGAPGGDTSVDRNNDGYSDGVLSTVVDESQGAFGFSFYQGTSMAAPHVAGLAALLLSVNPALTPAGLQAVLETTAKDLGAPGRDDTFGAGLVDALAAVQAAQVNPDENPLLAVSTTSLAFGSAATSLPLALVNAGGGDLTFSVTESETSGGDWLSVTPDSGNGTTHLTVTVDRTGLAPGPYTGQVQVTSNGGDSTVAVTMVVADATGTILDMGDIYVLAVNPSTFVTGAEDVVTASSSSYSFPDLPAGTWLLAAGPDLDDDGFICGDGEPCGLFPVLSDPVLVDLAPGEVLAGLDFAVSDALTLAAAMAPSAALPLRGFPLLSP